MPFVPPRSRGPQSFLLCVYLRSRSIRLRPIRPASGRFDGLTDYVGPTDCVGLKACGFVVETSTGYRKFAFYPLRS